MKLIKNLRAIRHDFDSLEEASDYWDEHQLSEEVLDQLADAPELDEALEFDLPKLKKIRSFEVNSEAVIILLHG